MTLERLVHRLGISRTELEGDTVRLIWRAHFQRHKAARLVCESVIAGIIHLAEQLTGRLIPVMEVNFAHPKPSDYSAHAYQQGFRAQCQFSQGENSIVIAADVLAWPLQNMARPSVRTAEDRDVVTRVKEQISNYSPRCACSRQRVICCIPT